MTVSGEAGHTTAANSVQTHVHVCVCARAHVFILVFTCQHMCECVPLCLVEENTQKKGQTHAQMEGNVFLKLVLHFKRYISTQERFCSEFQLSFTLENGDLFVLFTFPRLIKR